MSTSQIQTAPSPEDTHPGWKALPLEEPAIAFAEGVTFQAYLRGLPLETRRFMRRRAAWTRLRDEDQAFFAAYPRPLQWVLLVSDEMPDSMLVTPIVHTVAEASPRLSLSIVCDDMDLTVLNEMLDDEIDLATDLEEMDLPILFVFDEEWNQVAMWGPRPQAAEERLEAWLAAHPDYERLLAEEDEDGPELNRLMAELIGLMSLWYNDDLTQATVDELRTLMDDLPQEEADEPDANSPSSGKGER